MSDNPNFVALRAKSPFEAQVLITLLKGAGVKVVERHDLRSDEFAIAQRMLNQTGTQILIPRAQLADAKRAIAASREDQRFPEELLEEAEGEAPKMGEEGTP